MDVGSQSVWPTVTGPNFESGFSDAILQMWAAFLAEREGALGDGFGCARPATRPPSRRDLYRAAIRDHQAGEVVRLPR